MSNKILYLLCVFIIGCTAFNEPKQQNTKEGENTEKTSKLYLIGGIDVHSSIGSTNDVWSSSDGVAWKKVKPTGKIFPIRFGHQVVVFKDKLYLIAGHSSSTNPNSDDVWSSADGKTWTKVASAGDIFSARNSHQVVVFKNRLYLIGGYSTGPNNDIWSSSDGVAWKKVKPTGKIFSIRFGHQVVVFKDKLWLIAGHSGSANPNSDVWSSADGKTWIQETDAAAFATRYNHQVVVFKDRLYLIGGYTNSEDYPSNPRKNDVWNSADGKTWTKVASTGDIFSARENHQVVVFKDRLYLIGGYSKGSNNDVWSSSDGVAWKKVKPTGKIFSIRFGHQIVVFPVE